MHPLDPLLRSIATHSRSVQCRKPAAPAKVRTFLADNFDSPGPAMMHATISERRTILAIALTTTAEGAHLGVLERAAIAYRLGARLCALGAGAAPTTIPAVMVGDEITVEIDLDEAADTWRELALQAVDAEGIAR